MRNRYLDLLRSLAIIRVVVYHVTGLAALTLVFPAMSVMFALAGSLMAASLDRFGPVAVFRRLRRLLPSLWVLAAVFVPAMLLGGGLPVNWRLVYWLLPVVDPPVNGWGAIALSVIWYLRDYLWFVLVSPLALWLFRRAQLPTLLTPYLLLVILELGYQEVPIVLRDFGLYFGPWLLGFAHHDDKLRQLSRRVLVPVVLGLALTGAIWIFTHQGPRGYDLNDIRIGNALWSAAFILVVLRFAPSQAAWVDKTGWVGRLVTLLNRRALTVYLWHMPLVAILTPLAVRLGSSPTDPVSLAARVVAVFILLGGVILFVGWVEDLAARHQVELLPGLRRTVQPVAAASTSNVGYAPIGSNAFSPLPAQRRTGEPEQISAR